MSDNVVDFPGFTRLDIPVERIIDAAIKAGLTSIVIIGFDEKGDEYFASSSGSGASVLWDLERAKLKLLRIADIAQD